MVDLLITILTLIIALIFCKYMAYYIVYFYAKFIKFVSKGKIDIKLHPITFDEVLGTAMLGLLLLSIFKIIGII